MLWIEATRGEAEGHVSALPYDHICGVVITDRAFDFGGRPSILASGVYYHSAAFGGYD